MSEDSRVKVVVTGGRSFGNRVLVRKTLDRIHRERGIKELAQGGAHGADALALDWCVQRNIPCKTFHAQWARYGRRAGPIRNVHMLDQFRPDLVVVFPGGKGTQHCAETAGKRKIEIIYA